MSSTSELTPAPSCYLRFLLTIEYNFVCVGYSGLVCVDSWLKVSCLELELEVVKNLKKKKKKNVAIHDWASS